MSDHTHIFPSNRIILGLLLAFLGFMPWSAYCAGAEKPVDPAKVQIHVEHGIELPSNKPGFRIEISGWQPNGELYMYAISPKGVRIALIPEGKPAHVDENGELTLDIDYQRKGLGQGHWIFLIVGEPGIHEFETNLPTIEPPTPSSPKWRLIFGKDESKSM